MKKKLDRIHLRRNVKDSTVTFPFSLLIYCPRLRLLLLLVEWDDTTDERTVAKGPIERNKIHLTSMKGPLSLNVEGTSIDSIHRQINTFAYQTKLIRQELYERSVMFVGDDC